MRTIIQRNVQTVRFLFSVHDILHSINGYNKKVTLWIPSRISISKNEEVDKLAKRATQQPSVVSETLLKNLNEYCKRQIDIKWNTD